MHNCKKNKSSYPVASYVNMILQNFEEDIIEQITWSVPTHATLWLAVVWRSQTPTRGEARETRLAAGVHRYL